MKFCRDCVHYDTSIYGANSYPVCKRSKVTNMVSGEESLLSCQETRDNVALCGKEGAWFEPKHRLMP